MEREETIKALKWFKEYNEGNYDGGDYDGGDKIIDKYGDCYYLVTERDFEAFDMAIKALEQEPILDKVKQDREEINAQCGRKRLDDYDYCSGLIFARNVLDKLIESEET